MTSELRFGPNSAAVEAMLERLSRATRDELEVFTDARTGVRGTIWETARRAIKGNNAAGARAAAWDALWKAFPDGGAAWDFAWHPGAPVAWYAIQAVLVRDLISSEHFGTLTGPWREVFGPTWENEQ